MGHLPAPAFSLSPTWPSAAPQFPASSPLRRSPVRFLYPYRDVDTVVFRLPDGYRVETLPKETRLSAPFGTFQAKTVEAGDNLLVYVRTLEISTAEVPAASYKEYRQFFADIVKADRAQTVLVRKGEGAGL